MGKKRFLRIPKKSYYSFEGTMDHLGEEIPYEVKRGKAVMKVEDIVANPEMAERNISAYYGDAELLKWDKCVFHFSEYHCQNQTEKFNSHKCLCIYEGEVNWHLPGQCKHKKY